MVGQNAEDVLVGGWERRAGGPGRLIGCAGEFQQSLVRDLQRVQALPGAGELGGETVEHDSSPVTGDKTRCTGMFPPVICVMDGGR